MFAVAGWLAPLVLAASITEPTPQESALRCVTDSAVVNAILPGAKLSEIASAWDVVSSDDAPPEWWHWPDLTVNIQAIHGFVINTQETITHFWIGPSGDTVVNVVHHLKAASFGTVRDRAISCLGEPDLETSDGQLLWIEATWPFVVQVRTPRKPVISAALMGRPNGEYPIFLKEGPVLYVRAYYEGGRLLGFQVSDVVVPESVPAPRFAVGDRVSLGEGRAVIEGDYIRLAAVGSREVTVIRKDGRKVYIMLNAASPSIKRRHD